MARVGYVYIMTNKCKTVLYIGVTNNLQRRVSEHKRHMNKNSFTDRYNLEYCIYYEVVMPFYAAIKREKELKKWRREKKVALINKVNPRWEEVGVAAAGPLLPPPPPTSPLLPQAGATSHSELRAAQRGTSGVPNRSDRGANAGRRGGDDAIAYEC
ncbi:MAG: GIY-YIG nuclease family protein [Bacteroidales bacterium]|nr:GIY-YIG nuclease family protein [Bacteroidales bacterium]